MDEAQLLLNLRQMVTYILSEHPTFWQIHRYTDEVVQLASGVPSEENALSIAQEYARLDRPSRILRISLRGDSNLVAEFDDRKHDKKQESPRTLPPTPGPTFGGHVPGLF